MSVSQKPSSRFPASDSLAFISDIHGNIEALNAVIDELQSRKVSATYVAGDLFFGGANPFEVWRRLQDISARCIRGLSDTALIRLADDKLVPMNDQERNKATLFRKTREALGEIVLAHIRRLPESLRIPLLDGREILMVHGAVNDPFQEISADMTDEEIKEQLNGEHASIIVCGSSHVPFYRVIDEQHVINVGSVGQAPGGDAAHFTVVRTKPGDLEVEQSWVKIS